MSLAKKRWIKLYFALLFILLSAFIAFNYVIDPYGYNNRFLIDNLNSNKTQTEAQSRKFKVELAKNADFDALFLGSSEMTFLGNTHYISQKTGLKFFNLAFNEQEIFESLEYLKHILKRKNIKHVILGLHPFKFDNNGKKYRQDSPKNIIQGKDNLKTYLSYKTFRDSLKTVYKNYKNFLEIYDQSGWKVVDLIRYHHIPEKYQDQWLKERVEKDPEQLADEAKKFHLDMNKVEYLYDIIKLCQEKNIKLQLLFTPMYSKHYNTIYSHMHKEMDTLRYLIVQKHPFYDFSIPNKINKDYKNFTDRVSHARQRISYPLIDKLVDDNGDFGFYVTEDNIQEFLLQSK